MMTNCPSEDRSPARDASRSLWNALPTLAFATDIASAGNVGFFAAAERDCGTDDLTNHTARRHSLPTDPDLVLRQAFPMPDRPPKPQLPIGQRQLLPTTVSDTVAELCGELRDKSGPNCQR